MFGQQHSDSISITNLLSLPPSMWRASNSSYPPTQVHLDTVTSVQTCVRNLFFQGTVQLYNKTVRTDSTWETNKQPVQHQPGYNEVDMEHHRVKKFDKDRLLPIPVLLVLFKGILLLVATVFIYNSYIVLRDRPVVQGGQHRLRYPGR